MAIAVKPAKLHWNYFLALEKDMETVARYIEFCDANLSVFSIELARVLFASASEVDVVAKLLCEQIQPGAPRNNINEYKAVLVPAIQELPRTEVLVPRYGLSFRPWSSWTGPDNPVWWRSYNSVKHQRASHFDEATLRNALNALGALLIVTFHYYSRKLAVAPGQILSPKDATLELTPESTLLRLHEGFYHSHLIV